MDSQSFSNTTVQDLPSEILSKIFFFYCLPLPGIREYIWIQSDRAREREILAQVCMTWKEVVFSSCELWTEYKLTFHIPPPIPGPSSGAGDKEWVSLPVVDRAIEWLGRSKGLPCRLSIFDDLTGRNTGSEAIEDIYESLRKLFSSVGDRLGSLNWTGPALLLYKVWSILVPPLPRLESLTFLCFGTPDTLPATPPHSFQSSKLLKELKLFNCSQFLSLRADSNPSNNGCGSESDIAISHNATSLFCYTNITTLHLSTTISLEVVLDILPRCVRLVHCSVNVEVWHGQTISPSPRPNQIVLPFLRKLDITASGNGGFSIFAAQDLSPFLAPLRLPAFTHLTIQLGNGLSRRLLLLPALLDLHRRDPFHLKHLKFVSVDVRDRSILFEFLQLSPTLKSLHLLDGYILGEELLKGLTLLPFVQASGNLQASLLPILEVIVLDEQDAVEIPSTTIIDFVESRFSVDSGHEDKEKSIESRSHLKVVKIEALSLLQDDVFDEKARLWKRRGLEVSWAS